MKHFIWFLLLPVSLFAQHSIKGIVLDSLNQKPVPYATVFIDGTSKGCMTNLNGEFTIDKVGFPALLVVSHISYQTSQLYLSQVSEALLTIPLRERMLKLPEIAVSDVNKRNKNILLFKKWFLGTDYWGENALLKNDSVLRFIDTQSDRFKVVATAPLQIELPLLGYDLQVYLEDFTIETTPELNTYCNILGYYYFKPYQTKNRLKIIKYEHNRRKVYYNSILHFCRSLYSKQLKQNGYLLFESKLKSGREPLSIDSFISYPEKDLAVIEHLKDSSYTVLYSYLTPGKPANLTTDKKTTGIKQSKIYFNSDTCMIYSDGTIPDNFRIAFSGSLSEKRIGTYLPTDYFPRDTIKSGSSPTDRPIPK